MAESVPKTESSLQFHYMIILALVGYRVNDCLTKFLVVDLGVFELMFFRSLMTLCLIPIFFMFTKIDFKLFMDKRVLLRNFLAAIALFFEVAALEHLTLGAFVLLTYTAPIFAKFLARIFLSEKLDGLDFILIGLSLLGTSFIITTSLHTEAYLGVIYALVGAFIYACMMVVTKTVKTRDYTSIYFTYIVMMFVLSAFKWPTYIPHGHELILLVVMSLIHVASFMLSLKGLMALKTSHAAILEYLGIVFALILDYMVFNKIMTLDKLMGGSLIVFASLISIYRHELLNLIQKGKIMLTNRRVAATPETHEK